MERYNLSICRNPILNVQDPSPHFRKGSLLTVPKNSPNFHLLLFLAPLATLGLC